MNELFSKTIVELKNEFTRNNKGGSHIQEVIQEGKCQAVSIASLFHYGFIHTRKYYENQFESEGNVEFLQGRRGDKSYLKIKGQKIEDVKSSLSKKGIPIRIK